MTEDRDKAYSKVRNKTNSGRRRSSKKAKIIVRNLPFKNLTEKTLEEFFNEFGKIEEVKLLRKPDGKLKGCGFVQFEKVASAVKAINNCNQKELNGRKIILDWALPKDTYIEKVRKFQEENEIKPEIKEEAVDSDAEENDTKVHIDKKHETWASDESETEEDEGGSGVESSDIEEEDDVKDDDINLNRKPNVKNQTQKNENRRPQKPSDVEDGRTVFIRNVPFSATNNDLKECVETYGPVEYALICIDKLTEHSKGTAFVKFKNNESASQCVRDSNKLFIHESPLNVTYALTKEHLENKKTKKKAVKDSRNLYLVREGVVPAGSKAAAGVSVSDMTKRLQLEQWKSQILKNLNMFVSRTRLVVHNLPPHYDDQKLRQLFLKHGNPNAIIREAKVMWEKNKLDSKGKHVSKEVGFVSFADHEDALLALRNINNNPTIFTPSKRPIVAFSIENKAVMNQKQKRIDKSRAKLGVTIDEKMSKLNRKQRRFIRRRQKIIDQRREAKKLKEGQETKTSGDDNENPTSGEKIKRKRIRQNSNIQPPPAKQKKTEADAGFDGEFKSFTGVTAEPGSKVKLRSRFNLKKQAALHSQVLKKEKAKKKMKMAKRGLEPIKQPKQKKGKGKSLLDDAKLSKLISKHREDIRKNSSVRKWYES